MAENRMRSRGEYYRLIAELDSAIRQAALQYGAAVETTDVNEYDDRANNLVITIRLPKVDFRPDSTLSAVRAPATGETIRLEEGRHEAL